MHHDDFLGAFNLEDKKHEAARERWIASALEGSALTGSIKQNAWAEEIRRDFLKATSPAIANLVLTTKACRSSKWWIDNRKNLHAAARAV